MQRFSRKNGARGAVRRQSSLRRMGGRPTCAQVARMSCTGALARTHGAVPPPPQEDALAAPTQGSSARTHANNLWKGPCVVTASSRSVCVPPGGAKFSRKRCSSSRAKRPCQDRVRKMRRTPWADLSPRRELEPPADQRARKCTQQYASARSSTQQHATAHSRSHGVWQTRQRACNCMRHACTSAASERSSMAVKRQSAAELQLPGDSAMRAAHCSHRAAWHRPADGLRDSSMTCALPLGDAKFDSAVQNMARILAE